MIEKEGTFFEIFKKHAVLGMNGELTLPISKWEAVINEIKSLIFSLSKPPTTGGSQLPRS